MNCTIEQEFVLNVWLNLYDEGIINLSPPQILFFIFNNRLTNESLDSVYETECRHLAFTRFHGVIYQHFATYIKMQSCTTNYKNRHPWMTKALRTHNKIKKCNAYYMYCIINLCH